MTESPIMLSRTMADLRAAIVKRMKVLDWSKYRLVQELKGKRPKGKDVPVATLYEFMRGETSINSDDLGLILEVLGGEVVFPKPTRPRRKPQR